MQHEEQPEQDELVKGSSADTPPASPNLDNQQQLPREESSDAPTPTWRYGVPVDESDVYDEEPSE